MPSPFRRLLLCAALACGIPAALAQQQLPAPAAAKPSVASFFDYPTFGYTVLSPSGRYLAARSSAPAATTSSRWSIWHQRGYRHRHFRRRRHRQLPVDQ